ncbi:uncharacterized protein Z519_08433 [Cladophialophora bantiana CBS 173.52]|uniref:ABM domain-containing protein n=1 Tax=Cladophialophora bantiana (strain ATCC 10958 / CBS 173.52 / CDC B-1940 / NIH 8579) TaxID=1442370 RepID=A0A0D2HIS2_CLAB1|nr:uncharacterized protein Z519_08433 [Cladophialophora bantiana CBS 173.52]KIW90650.1 hypothetical protein Z519_08433 [Cladophialophora bantiana CBS 173.52]
MAIIELAHITLKNGITATDPELKKNLREVKRVIEDYSKLQTLFYTQIDDPSVMFVIGAWETKDHHQYSFDGSPQQAEILKLIKDQIGIDWMHYIDVDQSRIPLDAPVVAIIKETFAKHGVVRTQFDQEFASQTSSLGGARHGAISAWNIPKDNKERDVRVNFSGWESVEEATAAFANTIENVRGFRARPTELNFFFVKRTELD